MSPSLRMMIDLNLMGSIPLYSNKSAKKKYPNSVSGLFCSAAERRVFQNQDDFYDPGLSELSDTTGLMNP